MNNLEKSKAEIIREAELLIIEAWSWLDEARNEQARKAARLSSVPREQLVAFVRPLSEKLDQFERQLAVTMAAFEKLSQS